VRVPGPLYFDAQAAAAAVGDTLVLAGAEGHHAVDVRRLRAGEGVSVGDGAGRVCACTTVQAAAGRLTVRVEQVLRERERGPRVCLIQALAKGGRDELAIQAATEAGVDAVRPWQARRSIARWAGPKAERGRRRWADVVREASKQSLRATVPAVEPLLSDGSGTAALDALDVLFVLDPRAERPLSAVPAVELRGLARVGLLIGPEGGMSEADLDALGAAGAWRVRLGDSVLRTSSAGLAALTLLNAALGRW
jgi:16S rRNA (uracil1498-N3)-methyltransferase